MTGNSWFAKITATVLRAQAEAVDLITGDSEQGDFVRNVANVIDPPSPPSGGTTP